MAAALPNAPMYQEKPDGAYGLTPLEFAPTPTSFARPWFTDEVIEANLDHLEHEQQADGGWAIALGAPEHRRALRLARHRHPRCARGARRLRPAPVIRRPF